MDDCSCMVIILALTTFRVLLSVPLLLSPSSRPSSVPVASQVPAMGRVRRHQARSLRPHRHAGRRALRRGTQASHHLSLCSALLCSSLLCYMYALCHLPSALCPLPSPLLSCLSLLAPLLPLVLLGAWLQCSSLTRASLRLELADIPPRGRVRSPRLRPVGKARFPGPGPGPSPDVR